MKIKHKKNIDEDTYYIEFGNEIFTAYYHKEYPRLNTWSLHRYNPRLSNRLFIFYDPIFLTKKFKSFNDIKKFIRDRKYL
tara:strand:- start:76 stop:315 length:240 start_codon:yes stop_codon:yes gene_type:complete